jgi:hypothetical protein
MPDHDHGSIGGTFTLFHSNKALTDRGLYSYPTPHVIRWRCLLQYSSTHRDNHCLPAFPPSTHSIYTLLLCGDVTNPATQLPSTTSAVQQWLQPWKGRPTIGEGGGGVGRSTKEGRGGGLKELGFLEAYSLCAALFSTGAQGVLNTLFYHTHPLGLWGAPKERAGYPPRLSLCPPPEPRPHVAAAYIAKSITCTANPILGS